MENKKYIFTPSAEIMANAVDENGALKPKTQKDLDNIINIILPRYGTVEEHICRCESILNYIVSGAGFAQKLHEEGRAANSTHYIAKFKEPNSADRYFMLDESKKMDGGGYQIDAYIEITGKEPYASNGYIVPFKAVEAPMAADVPAATDTPKEPEQATPSTEDKLTAPETDYKSEILRLTAELEELALKNEELRVENAQTNAKLYCAENGYKKISEEYKILYETVKDLPLTKRVGEWVCLTLPSGQLAE